jgi:PadR family transcriptional regulator, regulatory protein PadR
MTEHQETPRMTHATVGVLRALLENPTRELYGLEVCAAAGLPTGTVHPILARLENLGWLESEWEQVDPKERGRPRRRYYRLSECGAMRALAAVQRAETQTAQIRARRPGLAPGNA